MARYSPSPVPTSGLDQTQRWLREEMEQIRGSTDDTYTLAQWLIDNFVASAYGSIGRETDHLIGTINATWQTLPWEQANIATPKGLQYDLPNGYILTTTGVWQQNILLNLAFDDAQAGRELQLRFFNSTDGVGGNPIDFYVGRNTDGITISIGYLALIDVGPAINIVTALADKGVELQIRSAADTFTNVNWKQGVWDFSHQSEIQFSILDTMEALDRQRGA